MRTKSNDQNRYIQIVTVFVIMLMLQMFVSCKSESYLDLLTGGGERYWRVGNVYYSYNKRTQRRIIYDGNLNVDYINGLDVISRGQYFKIVGNRVILSWVIHKDTIPIDSFDILEINNRKMVMKWTTWGQPTELIVAKNKSKGLSVGGK